MSFEVKECRSCGAEITWCVTESGKKMPVDRNPVPGGNIRLIQHDPNHPPLALYDAKKELAGAALQLPLDEEDEAKPLAYVSHFSTCPEARNWRKQ